MLGRLSLYCHAITQAKVCISWHAYCEMLYPLNDYIWKKREREWNRDIQSTSQTIINVLFQATRVSFKRPLKEQSCSSLSQPNFVLAIFFTLQAPKAWYGTQMSGGGVDG